MIVVFTPGVDCVISWPHTCSAISCCTNQLFGALCLCLSSEAKVGLASLGTNDVFNHEVCCRLAYHRPFGKTCGTPRQNAKLYPLVMAEMARVLRPGSGCCVVLVAQPHLLGLPEIRRDNAKDRKKQRKKAREGEREVESVHHNGSGGTEGAAGSEEHGRIKKRWHGEAISRQAGGSSSGASGASLHEPDEVTGSGAKKNKQTPLEVSQVSASPALRVDSNADADPRREGRMCVGAAPGALWRIRARHPVNVGGLISHLLVLERTTEPSPLPPSGRRKRLVGVDAYCKHRREDKGGVGLS